MSLSLVSSVFILRIYLQETYELYDCKFYDLGTSSEKDNLWYITNGTFNRTSEYTEIVEADTG
ncbi:MAG: hypothetical protein IJP99_06500, partial [Methanobrevibacter sp.]|nr:hypothetical protein [Methanobrevibacter sp.]